MSGFTYFTLHAHLCVSTLTTCSSDKKKDDKKKDEHEQAMETAEALDNWQKLGGPVVVGVESS